MYISYHFNFHYIYFYVILITLLLIIKQMLNRVICSLTKHTVSSIMRSRMTITSYNKEFLCSSIRHGFS